MDALVRDGVQKLKEEFLNWRDPPVDLPADSVIDTVIKYIIEETIIRMQDKD